MKQINEKSLFVGMNDRDPNWCIFCDYNDRCDTCDATDFGEGDCNGCDKGTECTMRG